VGNFAFAKFLFDAGLPWYMAAIPGAMVSSLWNFGVNTILTWRRNVHAVERRWIITREAGAGNPTNAPGSVPAP
jgi:hypothetical protein